VDGTPYGDGCIRLSAPLSPAVHLGADRILAIGIRHASEAPPAAPANSTVTIADIAGVLLDAVFLDTLDGDLERMSRINRTLSLLSSTELARHPDRLRIIPALAVPPSENLGAVDVGKLTPTLRYMLRGLGAAADEGGGLVSYLAFDASYTGRLLDLGLRDARSRRSEIEELLYGAPEPAEDAPPLRASPARA
jgi:NTE family protein